MKYIDADKLIAELTRMQFDLNAAYRHPQSDSIVRAISIEYDDIISLIASLQQEQPEVNIVTEYDEQFYADPVYGKLVNRNAGIGIARHFYELGLNARKEGAK